MPAEAAPLPPCGTSTHHHHLDAEAALLGLLMVGAVTLVDLAPMRARAPVRPAHRYILEAIVAITQTGQPVDTAGVAGRLRETGRLVDAGGTQASRTSLDKDRGGRQHRRNSCGSSSDAWARQGGWHLRRQGSSTPVASTAPTPPDIAPGQVAVRRVADRHATPASARLTCSPATRLTCWRRRTRQRRAGYVSTGYAQVDEDHEDGWWAGRMAVIGARPAPTGLPWASGRRSPAPDPGGVWRRRCAVRERGTPGREMRQRLLSHESRLAAAQVRQPSGRTSWPPLNKLARDHVPAALWVDDHARTIVAIRASVRRHVASLRPGARSGWWCWTTCNWCAAALAQDPQRGTDRGVQAGSPRCAEHLRCRSSSSPSSTASRPTDASRGQ